jgi:hypothetical protein
MKAHPRQLNPSTLPAYLFNNYGISVTRRCVDNWRPTGRGPRFRRWGRWVYYEPADVDEWVKARQSQPLLRSSDAPWRKAPDEEASCAEGAPPRPKAKPRYAKTRNAPDPNRRKSTTVAAE